MNRKQTFIEQEEIYEYHSVSPYRNNNYQQYTPRRGFQLGQIWSSSQYLQSSAKQQRSIFTRQSQQVYHNSSKQTKTNGQVPAFDDLLDQKEYSFKQQKVLPTFGTFNQVQQKGEDDENFYNQLGNIQQQMIALDQTMEKLESKMQDIKIQQLNFLNTNNNTNTSGVEQEGQEKQQQKYYQNNNSNQWKVFNLKKDIQEEQVVELGKPDDFEKLQIVYIQQNINGMVGRLSHLLQNQPQQKLSFRNTEIDEGGEICFTFNKNLNRFTKIYKCKFCPLNFQKACSLGGHISRSHKEESQQSKKEAQPIKKTSIQKQKKAYLQKSIGMQLMRQ
ncbi:unnamed protein product [Paramecium sonneborni]|uniref:C2H2-type domain-containing protein n=1 Tax=Paramecium sonneborni TaxID=65129 RepID=A0A8S1QY14_9CILI|nr:unnamed protein product [Paramecium sonneborni]